MFTWTHTHTHKCEIALSCPTLVTPRTVAYKASPSMGFSRQEYWNGLPFSSPGDLPNPGIKPGSPVYRLSHQGSPRNLTNFFLHDLKSPILDQWLLIFIGNTWDKRCSYRRPILMVYPELRHFSKLRKQF